MTRSPEVSIVIPVYNRKDMVAEAAASALAEKNVELEVIIVDNASDDGTWERCLEIAASDPRVRVHQQPENVGPVRNWKTGLELANAELVKILYSDDLILPGSLRIMCDAMDDPDVGLVFGMANVGSSPQIYTDAFNSCGVSRKIPSSQFMNYYYNRSGVCPISPCAGLFRTHDASDCLKTSFPYADLPDFAMTGAGPDVRLYWDIALRYAAVYWIDHPCTFFRAHEDSITVSHKLSKSRLLERSYNSAYLSFLLEYKMIKDFKCEFALAHLRHIWHNKTYASRVRFASWLGLRPPYYPGTLTYLNAFFFWLKIRGTHSQNKPNAST